MCHLFSNGQVMLCSVGQQVGGSCQPNTCVACMREQGQCEIIRASRSGGSGSAAAGGSQVGFQQPFTMRSAVARGNMALGTGAAAVDAAYHWHQVAAMSQLGAAHSQASTSPGWKRWDESGHPWTGTGVPSGIVNCYSAAVPAIGAAASLCAMTDLSQSPGQQARHLTEATQQATDATRWAFNAAIDFGWEAGKTSAAATGASAAGLGAVLSGWSAAQNVADVIKAGKGLSQREDLQRRAQQALDPSTARAQVYQSLSTQQTATCSSMLIGALDPESVLDMPFLETRTELLELQQLIMWSHRMGVFKIIGSTIDCAMNIVKVAAGVTSMALGITVAVAGASAAGVGPAVMLGFSAALGLAVVGYKVGRFYCKLASDKYLFRSIDKRASRASIDEQNCGAIGSLVSPGYSVKYPDQGIGLKSLSHHRKLVRCAERLRGPLSTVLDTTPRGSSYLRAALAAKILRLDLITTKLSAVGSSLDEGARNLLENYKLVRDLACALGHLHGMVSINGALGFEPKIKVTDSVDENTIVQLAQLDPSQGITGEQVVSAAKAIGKTLSEGDAGDVAAQLHSARATRQTKLSQDHRQKAMDLQAANGGQPTAAVRRHEALGVTHELKAHNHENQAASWAGQGTVPHPTNPYPVSAVPLTLSPTPQGLAPGAAHFPWAAPPAQVFRAHDDSVLTMRERNARNPHLWRVDDAGDHHHPRTSLGAFVADRTGTFWMNGRNTVDLQATTAGRRALTTDDITFVARPKFGERHADNGLVQLAARFTPFCQSAKGKGR